MKHKRAAMLNDMRSFYCQACRVWINGEYRADHDKRCRGGGELLPTIDEADHVAFDAGSDDEVGEVNPFYFLEGQARLEQTVVNGMEEKHDSDAAAVEKRTLEAFAMLAKTHKFGHRAGNAVLRFMHSILYDVRSLPRDMRTVRKRQKKLLKERGNTVELRSSVSKLEVDASGLTGLLHGIMIHVC
jgi:hypothetical protein